ncbi:MAG: peptidase S8, partial [Gemmatimonadetes bacterium]|nr:peptidase S8 [Gemmatimonadota bacterium]NIQ52442.1 peptidase S8 [Gemmatimonadota bacterium]NIU72575.1 peptidase S8 [Gammaproteobacteria bacterium]NIX42986.1 peptidase S8 [Gemmatimonadota bacterium]NIY07165.1 peptidase S8 [Gemmatimonadota bacterium]
QVRRIILESAVPLPDTRVVRPGGGPEGSGEYVPFGALSTTGGVVDAYAALKLAEERARETP